MDRRCGPPVHSDILALAVILPVQKCLVSGRFRAPMLVQKNNSKNRAGEAGPQRRAHGLRRRSLTARFNIDTIVCIVSKKTQM